VIRITAVALTVCLAVAGCAKRDAACWKPPASSPERDRTVLQMIASPDRNIQASGYALRVERCIDRLANTYGRGRDSADVIAGAVVEECRGDIETQASIEAPTAEDTEFYTRTKLESAKRRATILIVRDRAAKCI